MAQLKDKVAIITGARRGMGRTHALTLAEAGAKVIVSDIDEEDCQKVVEEIKEKGGEAKAVKCDVTKKEEVDSLIKAATSEWGRLDILVNNAGIADFKKFLEMTEEDWEKTIDINLKGYFLCSQAAAKVMADQRSGAIVNIASVAMGQVGVGFANLAHYCASKGGIVAMTEELAGELAEHNIRVNAVSPGVIETPMIDPIKEDPEQQKAILARIPMHREGKPEEVSKAVLFLASDDASYVTGSTLVVDGGWLSV